MMGPSLVVARKEIRDHLRDPRSVGSSVLYALMGPAVGLIVSWATSDSGKLSVLLSMLSIFALVSAFAGGTNIALDTTAGERERRSLVPLLLNPLSRLDVVAGKWLATTVCAAFAVVVNLVGCAVVVRLTSGWPIGHVLGPLALWLVAGLLPLSAAAAAVEVLVALTCRSVKEAHTWLSVMAFGPMLAGMTVAFHPGPTATWWHVVPLVGQQSLAEQAIRGEHVVPIACLLLALTTLAPIVPVLAQAARVLRRDDVLVRG